MFEHIKEVSLAQLQASTSCRLLVLLGHEHHLDPHKQTRRRSPVKGSLAEVLTEAILPVVVLYCRSDF